MGPQMLINAGWYQFPGAVVAREYENLEELGAIMAGTAEQG
jgi:hypothetical protein